ncbi:MAG: tRNA (N6-isopentenyl adenosine(37)-C2)-methylthiotransferase MiaB [Nitrospinaceae bacterium]|nr:MAG: tRNA (N6-isopentenyl adenosine(37)-C2)-methylthiotransferase MiaB [Nitrospinaceae bacterium]
MKEVYLDTYGCQMNVADSERMELLLFHSGYTRTHEKENADLILINTCSIREKAEQKIFSLFGHLKPLKEKNPDLILGLTGCLAQQEGERLLGKVPHLDLILGPDHVENIAHAVDCIRETGKPMVWNMWDERKNYSIPKLENSSLRHPGASAFVNIIKGCDKFCSFCVVPFTRGREKSREAEEIYNEIRQLVDQGAKEIILLGQNVNAYGKRGMDRPVAFHELLYDIAEIPGVERLRFTTSYPRDFTRELVLAYRDIDILMNHLHLPVQSGNDRILSDMRRGHTAQEYLDLVAMLKSETPGISLSTDIIVGYPGETEEEFQDTLDLMQQVGFSSSFMFAYSPRPGTPAALLPDSVPEPAKHERLQKTIEHQARLTETQAQCFLGKDVEVLIEGRSSKNGYEWKGRNPEYWRMLCSGPSIKVGDRVKIRVEAFSGHTLMGKVSKEEFAGAL